MENANFPLNLCFGDQERYADCIKALHEIKCQGYKVQAEDQGYNEYSGNVWILLDNGIVIFEGLGNEVEYMFVDPDNGEETSFDTYQEALAFLNGDSEEE